MNVGDRVRLRRRTVEPATPDRLSLLRRYVPDVAIGEVIEATVLPTSRVGNPYCVRFPDVSVGLPLTDGKVHLGSVTVVGHMLVYVWDDDVDVIRPASQPDA